MGFVLLLLLNLLQANSVSKYIKTAAREMSDLDFGLKFFYSERVYVNKAHS